MIKIEKFFYTIKGINFGELLEEKASTITIGEEIPGVLIYATKSYEWSNESRILLNNIIKEYNITKVSKSLYISALKGKDYYTAILFIHNERWLIRCNEYLMRCIKIL